MDRDLFEEYTTRLYDNFRVSIKNRRFHEFLWKELKNWSAADFVTVCQRILRNESWFPKLNTFLQYKDSVRQPERPREEGCLWCDRGNGMIFYEGKIQRARCRHADAVSPVFHLVDEDVDRAAAARAWYEANWRGVRKGLASLERFGVHMPSEVQAKIEAKLQETEKDYELPF